MVCRNQGRLRCADSGKGIQLVVLRQVHLLPVVSIRRLGERIVLNAERTETHSTVMTKGIEGIHGVLVLQAYLGDEERIVG